jgi:CRISPR/Cas system-associated endoribonuclease Cas2
MCAYFYLVDYKHGTDKIDSLEQYIKQGFPTIQNSVFKNQLIDVLLKKQFNRIEQQFILKILENGFSGYYTRYAQKLLENRVIYSDKWQNLLCSAATLESPEIDQLLVDVIVQSKPTEESLTSLLESTKSSKADTYFEGIISQVIEIMKPKGFFSKLKNIFRRNKK